MKQGLVEQIFILDRSGSMSPMVDEVISGFNSLVAEQVKINPDTLITTVLFDNDYQVIQSGVKAKDTPILTRDTYFARGSTALLDAVGRTIEEVGQRLKNTKEEDRPERVIVVITTDGEENSSRQYSKSKIQEMIDHQRDTYKWEFLFTCANAASFTDAQNLVGATFTYANLPSAAGYRSAFKGVTMAVSYLNTQVMTGNNKASTADIHGKVQNTMGDVDLTYTQGSH